MTATKNDGQRFPLLKISNSRSTDSKAQTELRGKNKPKISSENNCLRN